MEREEMTTADLIRLHRVRQGWTQQDLAERIGTPHRNMVSRWEQGMRPNARSLYKLAQALGLELVPDGRDSHGRVRFGLAEPQGQR